ncbi:GntR family transcriptional regulator [Kitasatospora sp. NPDC058063]|uniref:GntR family transcriptional regulator n=1 Tax=unclassified Kitasatospora TaxID=2633591 RepID=UPI0036DA2D93
MSTRDPRPTQGLIAELTEAISRGDQPGLRPGDQFPTTSAFAVQHGVSPQTASKVIQALKAGGLLSGAAGGKTWVRVPPVMSKRDTKRYLDEKGRAKLADAGERGALGVSEYDTGITVDALHHNGVRVDVVMPPEDVASALDLIPGEKVRRVIYERRHQEKAGLSRSTAYVPYELIKDNPDLLNPALLARWPGGLMNELWTIGIEVGEIVDHVTVAMPTAEEARDYDIPPGVPLIHIKKVTYDTTGRPVEVAFIPLPGDRVEMVFRTALPRWSQ